MTQVEVVDTSEKLALFSEHWRPKIVASLNDYHVKLVKLQGQFTWHAHQNTDELFLVLAGTMHISMRDREVSLSPGQLFVVPKGVEHRPWSEEECSVMLLEPAGLVNTGEAGGEQTAPNDVWI